MHNLSTEKMHSFVSALCTTLQANVWERERWCDLQQDFAPLAQSLGQYMECCNESLSCLTHSCLWIVWQPKVEVHSEIDYALIILLLSIEEAMIQAKQDCEYVYICNLLPLDTVKKHDFVESLITCGLSFLCILPVHAPGE